LGDSPAAQLIFEYPGDFTPGRCYHPTRFSALMAASSENVPPGLKTSAGWKGWPIILAERI
jgi:hypothetical protein